MQGCLLCYLFRGEDSLSTCSSGSPWIESADFLRTHEIGPLLFSKQMLWGWVFPLLGILGVRVCLFLLSVSTISLLPLDSPVGLLAPEWVFTLLTLFCGLFTFSYGEYVLPVFGPFLVYMNWYGYYRVVAMVWGELRVLLVYRLSWKSSGFKLFCFVLFCAQLKTPRSRVVCYVDWATSHL